MNGLHLDLKWSMPTKRYLENVVKDAGALGIDTILLEFENKLLIDWLRPAIHSDHWTAADLKWFLRLAGQHNIAVIPKVPLMGHMEWVLQWPQWAHLQENRDRCEICPSHPETGAFVRKLLQNVIDMFPRSPMIHLGGDETQSLGTCRTCARSGKSKARIYLEHYLPLIEQVESHGRRALVYCDMILTHPSMIDAFPRSVIICDWDYWSGTGGNRVFWGYTHSVGKPADLADLPRGLRRFRKYFVDRQGRFVDFPYSAYLKDNGFDVITFSAARCAGDNYCAPRTLLHVRNAVAAAGRARQLNLMGTLITSWAVRFNHLETNWPAIAASAWTYENPDLSLAEISQRFGSEFFGCPWPDVFSDLDLLSPALPDLHAGAADPYPPDIVHRFIGRLYENPKSRACRTVEKTLADIKRSYSRGLRRLRMRRSKITRHKSSFDHWLLAAETLVHKAKAVPVIVKLAQGQRVSSGARKKLLSEIRSLTARYNKLFGKTFMPVSRDMEINLRFAEPVEMLST